MNFHLGKNKSTMRAEEINLEEFESINKIYAFVDSNSLKLERKRDLPKLWVRYRNSVTNDEEREKAQFELNYLLHHLHDGIFFPLVHGKTGKAEKTCSYPDLSEGGKKEFDHLIFRAKDSKNPYLKAKYNHILWQCPSGLKNRQYAESASISYVDSIEILTNQLYHKSNDTFLSILQRKQTAIPLLKIFIGWPGSFSSGEAAGRRICLHN